MTDTDETGDRLLSAEQLIEILSDSDYDLCRGRFISDIDGAVSSSVFLRSIALKICYVFSGDMYGDKITKDFVAEVVDTARQHIHEASGLKNMYEVYFGDEDFIWRLNSESIKLCSEEERKTFILHLIR